MGRSLCMVMLGILASCAHVDRNDLGITPDDLNTCVRTDVISGVTRYPPPGLYDQEEIANTYLPYAVAALDVYGPPSNTTSSSRGFTLHAYAEEWVHVGRIEKAGGLTLDYYFHDADPAVFTVLIAFRGSENELGDWWSNASWITQFIPLGDQYDGARQAVSEIRVQANAASRGKPLTMLATGHSLGGGLAEHVAFAFPCTSAVVFDSSFVVNRHRLAEPFADAQVVHVFDKNDELTRFRRFLLSDAESPTYRRYGINPVALGGLQHRSLPLAVGMARMVAMCLVDPARPDAPGCPKHELQSRHARRLYCASTWAAKERTEPQCRLENRDL